MNAPEDPRIWQGIRTHLDELGSLATVPPIRSVLDRPRSGRPFAAVAGLAGAGALVLAVGLLLPGLLAVSAPMTGATPTSPSALATADALPTAAPVELAELIGHTYVATDVTENGQPIAIVPETQLLLGFTNSQLGASGGGCNSMGGDYEIRDGRLVTAHVHVTAMACAGERGQQESRFYMFLRSTPTISRDTRGLVLSTDGVVITFVEDATS